MRISDWSSDVCSSDLQRGAPGRLLAETRLQPPHRRRAAQQGTAVRPASAPAVAPTASPASLPAAPGDGIVAVVLKGYPRLSETFIAQEILALQQRGFRLQLVSRSEEHTSELQSLMRISYAVFCLKNKNTQHHY